MVSCLDLEEDSNVMNYLKDIEFIGLNRYEVKEKFSIDFSLDVITNYSLKWSATNSLLLRHKEAYLILKDYIKILKKDKDFFEKHHGIK